jgi:7-carboxy-7-deazaguanine synthase
MTKGSRLRLRKLTALQFPMRISEIFWSLQGEGRLTGVESVFVRACGCHLLCGFCDTPYAAREPEGKEMSVEEIFGQVEKLSVAGPAKHVVLTGGEPMIFADMVQLSARLHESGRHISIETSGTRYLPVACDLMSISPKLSNSMPTAGDPHRIAQHESNRHEPEVIERLIAEYDYQFKFVVGTPADCLEVEAYLTAMPGIDRCRAMLMPLGVELSELEKIAKWLEPYCAAHGLTYCPRKHIEWFGAGRGK